MRAPGASALLAALALAGCVGGPAAPAQDQAPETREPPPAPPLPEPIRDRRMVAAGGDPFNVATGSPCSQDASACVRYTFSLAGNATLTATLTWTVQANDFDLYLYEDQTQVGMSAGPAPQTQERIALEIPAGSYEIIVVAWLAAQDTYELEATFAPPA